MAEAMGREEPETIKPRSWVGAVEKESLRPEDFVRNLADFERLSTIRMREGAIRFLYWLYGGALALTFTSIFLQGFRAWGFNLDSRLLTGLSVALVAEIAGLAALVYGFLFPKQA